MMAVKGSYVTGNLLWLHNPRWHHGYSPKLQEAWDGLYKIVARTNSVVSRIRELLSGEPRLFHINRLARFNGYNPRNKRFGLAGYRKISTKREVIRSMYQDLFATDIHTGPLCCPEDVKRNSFFRKKYVRIKELESQNPACAGVLHLIDKGRSKRRSHGNPTYWTIRKSLTTLQQQLKLRDEELPKFSGINRIKEITSASPNVTAKLSCTSSVVILRLHVSLSVLLNMAARFYFIYTWCSQCKFVFEGPYEISLLAGLNTVLTFNQWSP